jgi:hypothetical protein
VWTPFQHADTAALRRDRPELATLDPHETFQRAYRDIIPSAGRKRRKTSATSPPSSHPTTYRAVHPRRRRRDPARLTEAMLKALNQSR